MFRNSFFYRDGIKAWRHEFEIGTTEIHASSLPSHFGTTTLSVGRFEDFEYSRMGLLSAKSTQADARLQNPLITGMAAPYIGIPG